MSETHRFTNRDHDIAYEVAGNGPPLLLLHGFPQTRAMWRPLVPELAKQFTVVTADLRIWRQWQTHHNARDEL